MSNQPLSVCIHPMQPADIPQVAAIEKASYSMPWPQRAYDYELRKNDLAHYFVLRASLSPAAESSAPVVGLGGFWLMADEMHITTIAIDPAWRRRGLGELMLLTLLEKGQTLGARVATLEVRPSNQTALSLYQKYAFQEAGRRYRYYTDNGEDALIFTTPSLALPDYQAMLAQRKRALHQKLLHFSVDKTG